MAASGWWRNSSGWFRQRARSLPLTVPQTRTCRGWTSRAWGCLRAVWSAPERLGVKLLLRGTVHVQVRLYGSRQQVSDALRCPGLHAHHTDTENELAVLQALGRRPFLRGRRVGPVCPIQKCVWVTSRIRVVVGIVGCNCLPWTRNA